MQTDNEQLQIEFHEKANAVFSHLLNSFELATESIDRTTEEHKFTQQKEKHINTLKQSLEGCAAEIMLRHLQNKKQQELSQNLQQYIAQYLHLFVQKTRTF